MIFHSIGVSRHRLGSDGVGVTTLVGGLGCPLDCRYCLNPQCKRKSVPLCFAVEELFDRLSIDDLYFEATGGGITFGGGEPLLQAEFIREFILYTRQKGKNWRFNLETCLAVDFDKLKAVDGLIDRYIVDIKDMNEDIYSAYTGKSSELMRVNLCHLAEMPDKVTVKIPLIPEFNSVCDVLHSETEVRGMGFTDIERFKYIVKNDKHFP